MSIQLIETYDSRETGISPDPSNQSITFRYILSGIDDELEARAYVENNLSAFVDGQSFNKYSLKSRGASVFDVEATYGYKKPPGLVTLNFDTGSDKIKTTQAPLGAAYYPVYDADYGITGAVAQILGTGYAINDVLTLVGGTNTVAAKVKVTQIDVAGGAWSFTVDTVGDYTVTPTNPVSVTGGGGTGAKIFVNWTFIGGTPRDTYDYKGAMGIKTHNGQTTAEGIDTDIPAFGFTMNVVFGPGFPLTSGFVQLCNLAAKHVNAFALSPTIAGISFTFNPGELFFDGATGSQKTGGSGIASYSDFEGEVTLKFKANQNIISGVIAGVPGVTKLGWDYLEVIYEEEVDDAAKNILPVVRQVNVNKIYTIADLSGLFIGSPTITSFSPTSGAAGTDSTTITGTNFFGVTSVLFNGTPAPYQVVSGTSIIAQVPIGATTGKITVKASGGSVQSATNFTVT